MSLIEVKRLGAVNYLLITPIRYGNNGIVNSAVEETYWYFNAKVRWISLEISKHPEMH